jgi:hypothetical protein
MMDRSMDPSALLAELVEHERTLHDRSVRRDPSRRAALLHPDFVEIGRSGRRYEFAEIVALLQREPEAAPIHAQDFAVRPVAPGLALLTYRSAHVTAGGALAHRAMRSSLWKRTADRCQVVFHQGTPTQPFAPAP